MALIGLNGYANSGKDTVALMWQYLTTKAKIKPSIEDVIKNPAIYNWWLKENAGWEIKKFSTKLKQIAGILLDVDPIKFEDQEYKSSYLSSEWDSYSIIRENGNSQIMRQPSPHDMNIWTNATEIHHKMTVREFLQRLGTEATRESIHDNTWVNGTFTNYTPDKKWIFTDCRFPNEAQMIKDKGGIMINIVRPGAKPVNLHPSETSLDDWDFDYKIGNVSDIIALMFTVKNIIDYESTKK